MTKKLKYTKLYIIGNGFDLHHNLDTWYSSFGLFLKKTYPDIYDVFLKYYGFGDLDENDKESLKDPMWSEFEAALATMDGDLLLENHKQYAPNYGSDDFSEGDRADIQIYIQNIVKKATLNMRQAFEEFINNVSYLVDLETLIINIIPEGLFLSFNYTDTLERYYNIDRQNIDYIHNKAGEELPLILGHGIDPVEFEQQEELPPDDPDKYEQWLEWMSDNYDYSVELGKEAVREYFQESFKPTKDVIAGKLSFFEKLSEIETVYVLGHSLSKVDLPYFIEAKKYLNGNEEWVVSYYKESEIANRKKVVMSLGVAEDKIYFKRLSEL